MNLYLIRHAEPDYARDGLTRKGTRQAKALAKYLSAARFTHVYCSPMGRARKTMAPVLKHQSVEPVTLKWLEEIHARLGCGTWAWDVSIADLCNTTGLAEEIRDVVGSAAGEAIAGFQDLLAEHGYQQAGSVYRIPHPLPRPRPLVAVFAHGGLITTLLAEVLGVPFWETYCRVKYPPTGITHLRINHNGAWGDLRLVSYAARPHLPLQDDIDLPDTPYMGA